MFSGFLIWLFEKKVCTCLFPVVGEQSIVKMDIGVSKLFVLVGSGTCRSYYPLVIGVPYMGVCKKNQRT